MNDILFSFERFINLYSFAGIPGSFLGGILVALSPCILPLLPVTLGVIGEAALASKLKTFWLSIIFVAGVTVTYTALGVISAIFGIFLGRLVSPLFINLGLGVIFIFLGLSFFDLFHFSIFNINYKPRTNFISVFTLGIICGLAMIPCALPVLGTILSVISMKRNIIYAIACLISFSLGYGLVLSVIGTSVSLTRNLASKTYGIIMIKRGMGIVIIISGIYFLSNLLRLT